MTPILVRSRRCLVGLAAALAVSLLAACDKPAAPTSSGANPATAEKSTVTSETAPAAGPVAAKVSAGAHADAGIAWHEAANDAEVDAAFATARSENKPVFVYWGAKWCPPCNQVKATLFNRQDFIERSRAFVPVYVDGDSPGAQKIGARFKVSGYPTMVLFNPQGKEVTRLPGEVDPIRYTEVLTLGMNAARPVGAVLADALARPATLGPNDWRLLAFYSWETDQQQVIAKDKLPATMLALANACPVTAPDAAMRLRLKALAFADEKKPPRVDPATRAAVVALLGDPVHTREQTDLVTNYASEIVRATSAKGTADRKALVAAFDGALKRLEADPTLSRADRMQALIAQVDLARVDEPAAGEAVHARRQPAPQLPAALVADVREQAARADREITNGYERQAVITAAAYMLERAGLGDESDALLKANLTKSHSPYYLMSELASNAKKRGDTAEALHWYREAYDKSEGPATRLQWGASYIVALIELAPQDEKTIEAATAQLWSEAATQPDAFYMRSARSLQRVGEKLQAWNKSGAHRAAMARLDARLTDLCAQPARSGDERATCEKLLGSHAKPAAQA
ncbi:MAG TPA: thioredoxin fold domain-containing protein [Caldimonas sp.]|nr:thioredoxin fold domain-containing protein [Caldimonas sp.]HEX4233313.1 thioredoxin fold domain-containing protein [Caldimonas sp.]